MRRRLFPYGLIVLLLSTGPGCGPPKPPRPRVLSPSEATKRLVNIAREEYHLTVIPFPLKNTLWIYVPLKDPFLTIEPSASGPFKIPVGTEQTSFFYLDAAYKDRSFIIQYDRGVTRSYSVSPGYRQAYTEPFLKAQRAILPIVHRALADARSSDNETPVDRAPGDIDLPDPQANRSPLRLASAHPPMKKVPDFIVVVIADLINGIERHILVYYPDLRRAMGDMIFSAEFQKRAVFKEFEGHKDIVGDTEGRHLVLKEITMPEFLAEQILNRLRLKIASSAQKRRTLRPPEKLVPEIIHETVTAYDFQEFDQVIVENVWEKTKITYTREDILNPKMPPE